jgi:hypothetical protein
MFFEEGNDPVLMAVPASRRKLLILKNNQFDVRLRGEDETPFFGD